MRVWDCHVHCRGGETPEQVSAAMEQAGLSRINLFSRYPGENAVGDGPPPRDDFHAEIERIAALQAADPDRVYGLFWVDPRIDGVLEELEHALVDRGLRGVKMIPNHWSPCDDFMLPVYAKLEELGKPLQFHSGILYGFSDSSRFCQPVLYETLVKFPKLKFALAHISWPWVDECLAVFGRYRAASGYGKRPVQMYIDCCRGTPDAWRLEALRKAVPFCTTQYLMYGTDGVPENLGRTAPEHIKKDLDILRNVMGLSEAQLEQFFWGTAEALYS